MLRKAFLSSVAVIGLTGFASAADMQLKAPPIAPTCAQFGGFYGGANVGWKYYNNDWKDRDNFGFLGPLNLTNTGSNTETNTAWEAGVEGGYNYQLHCTVFGLQADWNWTDAKADNFYTTDPGSPNISTLNYSSRENWFGTLRTRSGIVVDNLLLYVTGGLAWANFDRNLTYTAMDPLKVQAFSSSNTSLGFVVGFGTEWAFNQNWSIKSEILYMGFEKDQQSFSCSIGICAVRDTRVPYRYEFTDSQWVTRIGVNYRFNSYY